MDGSGGNGYRCDVDKGTDFGAGGNGGVEGALGEGTSGSGVSGSTSIGANGAAGEHRRGGGNRASPGKRFREAIRQERPLQIAGAVNAYAAMLAQATGFRALYVSGAGVANASFGLPDLGITTLNDVAEDVRRIAGAVNLPILADADTGFGSAFNIARTVREMIRAGAAGIHIEDQVAAKRCGHRPNKAIVPQGEMEDRIASAADARHDEHFVLMARTDALASEGMEGAIARALAYVDAGADMIFLEAATTLEEYRTFTARVKVPVLANVTEFGRTPLMTAEELGGAGVAMVLYPLSAFRAMNAAALQVYRTIRGKGTQADAVHLMQTREDLYGYLDYYAYERKLDALFDAGRKPEEG
ncbi:methylisocitrate lyase [Paenibacillus sacheonensis]|uniref:2-methylisocitrate lyase n=1 Tax=Paenibacillus sacheonensis TaxID=742054 RepID=A0A7X4YLC6_9BACL|nr:methylisocitrate lyase [Paenibacillus sacheonensis]MBM7568317.1 methylisocitrate lyase [Paenibacillus sacheonensis]NBC68498.1 methylisocitrate lyase [Paenibacillus sacheonensis]